MALSSNTSKKKGCILKTGGCIRGGPSTRQEADRCRGPEVGAHNSDRPAQVPWTQKSGCTWLHVAPPPSRASFGLGPRCPVPGPGGKPRSPGSAPCLAGFPNASCANQHRSSSLEMLTVFLSVTSSTHGSRPLSTSRTVFLSVSVRHLRQL